MEKTEDIRHQKDIELIWKHTHKDYRGSDEHSIMYWDEGRGTVLGPILTMNRRAYDRYLQRAKKKEINN